MMFQMYGHTQRPSFQDGGHSAIGVKGHSFITPIRLSFMVTELSLEDQRH